MTNAFRMPAILSFLFTLFGCLTGCAVGPNNGQVAGHTTVTPVAASSTSTTTTNDGTATVVVQNLSSTTIYYLYIYQSSAESYLDRLGANVLPVGQSYRVAGLTPGSYTMIGQTVTGSAFTNTATLTAGQTYTWTVTGFPSGVLTGTGTGTNN